MAAPQSEAVMRGLALVWTDFVTALEAVPIIEKLRRGKFRLEDYRKFLIHHRQQVVEGARWIARAASSIGEEFFELRSLFMRHAVTEHRDFKMLEENYISVGGKLEEIQHAEKNIGTEALHAFMFHRSSQPNPFDLLGAMFIIEGLGLKKSGEWGAAIKKQLGLEDKQVSFLLYHSENDSQHMNQFDTALNSGILEIQNMGQQIIKTAKITASLYKMQLEEMSRA